MAPPDSGLPDEPVAAEKRRSVNCPTSEGHVCWMAPDRQWECETCGLSGNFERYDLLVKARDFMEEQELLGDSGTPAPADVLIATLELLPKPADVNAVEGILDSLRGALRDATDLAKAGAREKAIRALKGKLDAPARLVDAALKASAGDSAGDGLQGSPLGLEDPVPWEEPVNGAELLDEIERTLCRFVVLPDRAAVAVALWAVFAHAHDAFQISPLLTLSSPIKRCGKTTALQVIGELLPRSLFTSNITSAALFRAVETGDPSLLVDEGDSFMKMSEELRGILNSGHTRATAYVVRTVGEDHEPRRFSTWCPKVVALIGKLPDTLEDRSVLIPMQRKGPREKVETLRLDRLNLEELRRKAARWAEDHAPLVGLADPEIPAGLNDRAADNWRPLLAIADRVGGDWPARAPRAALLLSGGEAAAESSRGVELLADVREIFDEADEARIYTARILEGLHGREERSWGEYGRSAKPLSTVQLASLLKPFEIKPRNIREGGKVARGYRRADFEDAWERYLPPSEPLQPLHPSNDGGLRESSTRYKAPAVAGREEAESPRATGDVAGVAAQAGGSWGEV